MALLGDGTPLKDVREDPRAAALRGAFGGRMSAGFRVRISTTPPTDDVAFNVEAFADMLGDLRPIWTDVHSLFAAHQRRHFRTQGASTGPRWPSNTDPVVPRVPGRGPYDRYKKAAVGHLRPLEFTGALRRAATGGAGALKVSRPTSMAMGIKSGPIRRRAINHHEGRAVRSALFGRTVQLKERPVIRFDGRPFRAGQNGLGEGPRSFGRGVQQLVQAHVVAARKRAMGQNADASRRTIDRILSEPTR
jgi:hypothetical protein